MSRRRRAVSWWVVWASVLTLLAGLVGVGTAGAAMSVKSISLVSLSNQPGLVSGNDVLLAIEPADGLDLAKVKVKLNGRDITSSFRTVSDSNYQIAYTRQAYVDGLDVGLNEFTATAPGFAGSLTVTNSGDGPVFSGPRAEFYRCPAGTNECAADPTFKLFYVSSNPLKTGLQPYDPDNPPSDVADTTSDTGTTVPFIVQREDGWIDRDRYTILTLIQPGSSDKVADQPQFNHKLLMTHGGNCGASYGPGEPPLDDYSGTIPAGVPGLVPTYQMALGRGFSVLSTALDNTGHNCSVAKNAESLMQAKEHFVEQYAPVRYTIGTGCSGGAIAQHTVANAYPGIYQGLTTTCSYPDVMTAGAQFADYHLLRKYFEDPTAWGPGVAWLPTQMAQVEGHITHLNAIASDELLYKTALDPENDCTGTVDPVPGDPSTRYDSETNPPGVRCSVLDLLMPQLGPRPESVWTPQEQAAGRGFGGIPFANEGLLYGLKALEAGQITTAQFVDLNVKIGGLDVDSQPITERTAGDPLAVSNAYRTGLINEANNLSEVAIINFGGPDPGIAHDYAHAFWTEDRLQRAQGHTDNRVMWFGLTPLIGDPGWAGESVLAMDRWLSAIEQDSSSTPLADKIVDLKPKDITDRCSNVPGVGEVPGEDDEVDCVLPESLQLRLSTPREVAGGDRLNDIVSCQLKPIVQSGPLSALSDGQFASLAAAYPKGECDFAKQGIGQGPARPWLTYFSSSGSSASGRAPFAAAATAGVEYGGRTLPAFEPCHGAGLQAAPFALNGTCVVAASSDGDPDTGGDPTDDNDPGAGGDSHGGDDIDQAGSDLSAGAGSGVGAATSSGLPSTGGGLGQQVLLMALALMFAGNILVLWGRSNRRPL